MPFEPQNPLESSLVKAAGDPAHRPQFYRDLVQSDLFVIQEGAPPASTHERIVLAANTTIQLRNVDVEGRPCIPVFTSLLRLQAVVDKPVAYLGINAIELMKLTAGTGLLLNPGSDYGKEITSAEAASIVDGSIWEPVQRRVTTQPTKVLLGQPARYPAELVEALRRLFATNKDVKRAWLAHFHDPSQSEKPHTLIGVEAGGGYEAIAAAIGVVVASVQIPDPPVDITPVGDGNGLDGYFLNECEPFYKRRRFLGLF